MVILRNSPKSDTSLKESEKEIKIHYLRTIAYYMLKIVKIGPVNPEIISLQIIVKKYIKKNRRRRSCAALC